MFEGCQRFFEPGYARTSCSRGSRRSRACRRSSHAGAEVADIGCGQGASTIVIAEAYPNATVDGTDSHDGSIAEARRLAAEAGVGDRVDASRSRPPTRSPAAATTW